MKNEKPKKRKNRDNQDDSPKNKPMMGKIGVDRSEELKKITEEENDLENWKRKKLKLENVHWCSVPVQIGDPMVAPLASMFERNIFI